MLNKKLSKNQIKYRDDIQKFDCISMKNCIKNEECKRISLRCAVLDDIPVQLILHLPHRDINIAKNTVKLLSNK